MSTVPFIVFLAIAVAIAIWHENVLPKASPGGLAAAITVGFFGAWIGSSMMWHLGPDLAGVPLLPTAIFSGIAIKFFSLISGGQARTWDR